jgi:hypothetical protein
MEIVFNGDPFTAAGLRTMRESVKKSISDYGFR